MALKWLLSCKDLMGKLARWSLKLQTYNFDVFHKGRLNRNVDALSHLEVAPVQFLIGMAEMAVEDEDEVQFELERQQFIQQTLARRAVTPIASVGILLSLHAWFICGKMTQIGRWENLLL